VSDLRVDEVAVADAAALCDVIRAGFAARPRLDPPSTAVEETPASVAAAIRESGGLLCRVDGVPAGGLLFAGSGAGIAFRRVSVVPHFQSRGVASAVVGVAEEVAAGRGHDDVCLLAREELPATVTFWTRRGYAEVARAGTAIMMGKALPAEVATVDADGTRAVGRRLAALARPGDVLVLTGELGAGKTTLAQGIGAGLAVRGEVTSPTFVISRVHPPQGAGPALVHVDAYRLGDGAELDDLDLDASVDTSVTVVEWGDGLAEALADHRLRVHLARGQGDEAGDARTITVTPLGARWFGAGVRSSLLGPNG